MLKQFKTKIIDWCLNKTTTSIGNIVQNSNTKQENIIGPEGELKFTHNGTSNLLVETPKGWSPIKRTLQTIKYDIWVLKTKDYTLKCADEHLVITPNGQRSVDSLSIGDEIITQTGVQRVTAVYNTFESDIMYDLELDDEDHVYYTNGILSHNTITAAIYLLWFATFHKDKLCLIASKSQSHAMEIASRIRFAYEELPSWIKCGLKYYNRHNIEFDNGSRIVCEATTEKTARGLSVSALLLDELAFVNPRIQTELWASLTPTLSTGGMAIITSTPNGDTDLFASLWRGASDAGDGKPGSNGYAPFQAMWYEHPDRGPEYWDEMVAQLGPVITAQEVGCMIGGTLIETQDGSLSMEDLYNRLRGEEQLVCDSDIYPHLDPDMILPQFMEA